MTRGMRNNNPFNIRRSKSNWLGKVPFSSSTDNEFEQFINFDFGYRAGIILFRTYMRKYHLTTPRQMISRFAPSSENDLESYFIFLSNAGVCLDKPLEFGSSDFCRFCSSVCYMESADLVHYKYIHSIIRKFKLF